MNQDRDPAETREWLDALDSVEAFEGVERVDELLSGIVQAARRKGAKLPFAANTAYINTIAPQDEPAHPGDREIEHKIRSLIRWNAAAIVLSANKKSSELGGHIASFQSAATLYDTGFMHFWHAPTDTHGGDLIYFQGHCSPGIYARAYLEGRLTEEQLAQLPAGGRRQGSVLLSASLADAGFLAVSDGVDGPRAVDGDLSGALPAISARPRSRRHQPRKVWAFWATARWTSRNRSARFRWPDARISTI